MEYLLLLSRGTSFFFKESQLAKIGYSCRVLGYHGIPSLRSYKEYPSPHKKPPHPQEQVFGIDIVSTPFLGGGVLIIS